MSQVRVTGGVCTLRGHRGESCSEKDCRWFVPVGRQCSGCSLAAACPQFENVDDSNQLTLDFDGRDEE